MTKKNAAFVVGENLNGIFKNASRAEPKAKGLTVVDALAQITGYMVSTGFRPRTISDYNLHVQHFVKITGVEMLAEIKITHIYDWLASMEVSDQTKLTRLKCLKAFLGRCFDYGWLESRFWKAVVVKVDSPVKQGAAMYDVDFLLNALDLSDFVQLRDATALLLMIQTGLRVGTVAKLEEKHVDLDEKMLKIDGGILKNHQRLFLPISDQLATMLSVLITQNNEVRRHYNVSNKLVFVTRYGTNVVTGPTNNNIQKRLNKYAKDYGLKNINPQALRRGFAKSLLDKGANVALISKALGHADIEVTTRYLYLDKEDVAEDLRAYL